MQVGRPQATNIDSENPAQQPISGTIFLWALVFLVAAVIAVITIWFIPAYFLEPNLAGSHTPEEAILKIKADFRKSIIEKIQTISGIFTAFGLVFTIYFAARNVAIGERNSAIAARTASDNLRATLDGKITDRFAKAIEQLGGSSVPCALAPSTR
jgi:hypothetical protein